MSVDCIYFIEVKDKDGKWNLVKWYADGDFDTVSSLPALDHEREVEVDGKKFIERCDDWMCLDWRDELSWHRAWNNTHEPKDMSTELQSIIDAENKYREEARKDVGLLEGFKYTYNTNTVSELWGIADKRMEDWKANVVKHMRDTQLDEIRDEMGDLKKLIKGEEVKRKKAKSEDEYEETLEYYFDEELERIISLRNDLYSIKSRAAAFVGNRWVSDDDIRIIYYFE